MIYTDVSSDYDGDGVSSWWEWGIDGMLYAADFAFGGPTGESLVAKGALTGVTKGVGKSVNQLNKLLQKGKVPKGIKRFDKGKGTKNLPYDEVHFEDGSSLYKNGTWRHDKGYKLTNEQIIFLQENGWTIPR